MTKIERTNTKARTTKKAEQLDMLLIDDLERKVREARALSRSTLAKSKRTGQGLAELERRGLERTPEDGLRVPIEAQLLDLLQFGAHVPLTGITTRVKGARKAEIEGVIARLARAGKASVVIRGGKEVVVGATVDALSATDCLRFDKMMAQLNSLSAVSKGHKPRIENRPRTILRSDLAAILKVFEELVRGSVEPPRPSVLAPEGPRAATPEGAPRDLVDAALRRLEDPSLKLVRIPALVRTLAGKLSMAEVHRVLLEAADGGAIELHPDAGSEFLKPEDALLCPPGPRDTVFSYARLLPS